VAAGAFFERPSLGHPVCLLPDQVDKLAFPGVGSGGTDAQRREADRGCATRIASVSSREPGCIDSAALIKINDLPPN
jgi:hypothetical protein